jgi:hypothetical protein
LKGKTPKRFRAHGSRRRKLSVDILAWQKKVLAAPLSTAAHS